MRPIDEKIVKMRLENSDFESKARQSLSTLLKLNRGVSDTPRSSGMGRAIDDIASKFTNLGIIGITALQNITNKAVDAGLRIGRALTVEPVMDGFREYEIKMGSIQTILANTSHKGTKLKDVTGVLDDLNHYADKTIYNFAEMTRNIGTFTAAGIDLKPAAESIKGIANLAAVSGSNSAQASTAMYQLSQAMAAGTVKLQDWNSVVNAGMGGKVFQNALIETAKVHGVNVDKMIKEEGSFRESLQKGWITTEVLTETLKKFTGELSESQLKSMGYTDKQIKDIIAMGKMATEAATKVRTVTQLIDTVKEALGSGWAETWNTIIGDFEEATELLTGINDIVSGFVEKSSESRNNLVKGVKDLGGIKSAFSAIGNILKAVGSFIKPIGDGFRDIFPPRTAKQITDAIKSFEQFTQKLKLNESQMSKLRTFAKGLFSVLDAGLFVVKKVAKAFIGLIPKGTGDFVLNLAEGIGELLLSFSSGIKSISGFNTGVSKTVGFLDTLYTTVKKLTGGVISSIFNIPPGALSLSNIFKEIGNSIKVVIKFIGELITQIGLDDIVNAGFLGGMVVIIKKITGFLDNVKDQTEGAFAGLKRIFGEDGIISNIQDSLQSFSENLKADTLRKLAVSMVILAGAMFIMSKIDAKDLTKSLAGVAGGITILVTAMKMMDKLKIKSKFMNMPMMIAFSSAIVILAAAMKIIATIPVSKLKPTVAVLGAVMLELTASMAIMSKVGGKFRASALGMIGLATSVVILVKALQMIAEIDAANLKKGLVALSIIMTELALFSVITKNAKIGVGTGVGLLAMAAALALMARNVRVLGDLDVPQLVRGLSAMGIILAEIAIFSRVVKSLKLNAAAVGVVTMAAGLALMIMPIKALGKMSVESLAKGLGSLGIALGIVAVGAQLMKGKLLAATALTVMAGGILILTAALKALGSLSLAQLGIALGALAGSLLIIGGASLLLAPVAPAMLAIAAAFGLLGAGIFAAGAGALMLLTVVDQVAATPGKLLKSLNIAIDEATKAIVLGAPKLATAGVKMISETLKVLVEESPKIISMLGDLFVKVIDGLAVKIPDILAGFGRLFNAIFKGVMDLLKDVDPKFITNAVLSVGAIAVVAKLLAGLASVLPQAMVGLLAAGVLITELALVLAAIGALNKIPGLQEFVERGGDLLNAVGEAIGGFIGGFIDGILANITTSLPKIGKDLSSFMTNLKPFIDGAKDIDPKVLDGVKSIAGVVIALTAANIVEGLGRWLTGGRDIVSFGEQLALFGPKLKSYSDSIKGIDANLIYMSSIAAGSLAAFAKTLPKTGGLVGLITGGNDIVSFGEQLALFGPKLKSYSTSIEGISPNLIIASSLAAGAMAEFAEKLPKEGGLVGLITGGNDIVKFGDQLALFGPKLMAYNTSIDGISPNLIVSSSWAAGAMAKFAENLPKTGGLVGLITGGNDIVKFGEQLALFGPKLQSYSDSITNINPDLINKSSTAAISLTKFADAIPKKGGLVGLITGDNDIVKFGEQLALFGPYLSSYSEAVTGVQIDPIAVSVEAGKKLVTLVEAIPSTGGIASWFTGDVGVDDFGKRIVSFAGYLKSYAAKVEGIDIASITNSATAAYKLAELAKAIPNSGGLMTWFTGDNTIDDFGYRIVKFGGYLKQYASKIVDIDTDAIANSATAAYRLAELAQAIPNSGGMMTWFTGDNAIDNFGLRIVKFGGYLKEYSETVKGIVLSHITNATTAAEELAGIQKALPTNGGLKSLFTGGNGIDKFGKAIVKFGEHLARFSDIAAKVSPANVAAALESTENILKTLRTIKDVNVDSITAFKKAVDELGKVSIDKLVDAFKGGEPKVKTAIEGVIKVMKTTFAAANTPMSDAGKEHVSKYISGLNSKPVSIFKVGATLAGRAKEGLGSVSSSSVGSNFVQGFINKMAVRGTDVWNAAYTLAGKALSGMRTRLKVKSPSRAAGEIGNFTVLGFLNKIVEGGKSVYSASKELAGKALDGLQEALGAFESMNDADVELNPTIKPVLDLSNMSRWNPPTGSFNMNTLTTQQMRLSYAGAAISSSNGMGAAVVQNDYKTEVNNTGLLDGAVFHVREEADIPKIAREIVKLENEELLRRGYRP